MKKYGIVALSFALFLISTSIPSFGEVKVIKPAGFDLPTAPVVAPHGFIKDGAFLPPALPAPKDFPPVRVGSFEQQQQSAVVKPSRTVKTCVFKPESTDGCVPSAIIRGDDII